MREGGPIWRPEVKTERYELVIGWICVYLHISSREAIGATAAVCDKLEPPAQDRQGVEKIYQ